MRSVSKTAGRAQAEGWSSRKVRTEKTSNEGSTYIAGTARRFERLLRKYREYLLDDDPDVLPILLGAIAAHRLDGEPSWLLIVGPPGGGKTDRLTLVERLSDVRFLSDLTDKTLASGLTPDDHSDPSLLADLKNAVLVFKDFTTVLEMRRDTKAAVIAQLREVYDGRFDKAWGTGKKLTWHGRLSLLAGVTPVIDRHYAVMNVLGQRFMLLRPQQPDREEAARRALDNCERDGHEVRESLSQDVRALFDGLPDNAPTFEDQDRDPIIAYANVTTRARSGVERDRQSRELNYAPEPEMPTRFARQLFSLARGIAMVRGHSSVEPGDLACVRRVAADSIPTIRRALMAVLTRGGQTVSNLANRTYASLTLVRRTLEDLESLGLVTRIRCGKRHDENGDTWFLHETVLDDARSLLAPLGSQARHHHCSGRREYALESLEG
jgi:hypothetical protein